MQKKKHTLVMYINKDKERMADNHITIMRSLERLTKIKNTITISSRIIAINTRSDTTTLTRTIVTR